jgi:hypothetical protein
MGSSADLGIGCAAAWQSRVYAAYQEPGLTTHSPAHRLSHFPGGTVSDDNKGMKRAGRLAVVVAALTAASCTAGTPPTVPLSAKPSAPSSPAHLAAGAPCPVTRPTPHASPPTSPPLPVPYLHGWYGNAALSVGVPTGGVLPAERSYGTPWPREWGTKFPWWRLIAGTLTITARRLDGSSAGFHSQVPDGYGGIGFVPSGLFWPAPGCWQVTGTVARHSLTFVARVRAVHS